MKLRHSIAFGLMIGAVLTMSPAARAEDGLSIYCWQGFGTGSNLADTKFVPRWKAVLRGAANKIEVELIPSADRILEKMRTANILYASVHSGIPKGGNEQALQVGAKGTDGYVLSAQQIAAIRSSKCSLVIINGCSTIPLLPESGQPRNIATALGISDSPTTKGRAYIGFQGVHGGAKGDDFFRVFFYFWSGVGAKNATLAQAKEMAKSYIEEQVTKLGGDKAQTFYLSNAAAHVSEDMVIIGDSNLKYSDLKP